jgi:hypothetical protein
MQPQTQASLKTLQLQLYNGSLFYIPFFPFFDLSFCSAELTIHLYALMHLSLSGVDKMTPEERRRELIKRRRAYIVKRVKDLIALARQTYYRKDLTPEELASHSDAEVLGNIVSETLQWEPKDILTATYAAFEDANMHTLNTQFQGFINGDFWLLNKEKLKKITAVFDSCPEQGGISLHDHIEKKTDLFK